MAYTRVKTAAEINAMRESGKMLGTVLKWLEPQVVVGRTTKELADLAGDELAKLGGKPAFLDYQGFPDVICICLNDEVVHGIPGDRIIESGDIVSLDFGVSYQGMITDAAISIVMTGGTDKNLELVKDTKKALYAGIKACRNGCTTGDIGHSVEASLKSKEYGIVRDLVGHGVGHEVHEDPNIPNYGHKNTGDKLLSGMTIAIEPMVTLGGHGVFVDADGWTIKTRDRSLSAHFEHTILITDHGSEILTAV